MEEDEQGDPLGSCYQSSAVHLVALPGVTEAKIRRIQLGKRWTEQGCRLAGTGGMEETEEQTRSRPCRGEAGCPGPRRTEGGAPVSSACAAETAETVSDGP